MNSAVKHEYLK